MCIVNSDLSLGEPVIAQSTDLTELARQGKLDPTIGRDEGTYFEFSKNKSIIAPAQ
jgi:hypothetical protein